MPRESNIWSAILRANWPGVWQRIENRVMTGMPDVHYTMPRGWSGWVELKYRKGWPVRKGIVTLPLITREQRLWHQRLALRGGGRSWWLLRVAREDFLFDGLWGANHLGLVTEETMRACAVCVGLPGAVPSILAREPFYSI